MARVLERLQRRRFRGLDVTLTSADHVTVDRSSVGLWVVPPGGMAPEEDLLSHELRWVPLARSFTTGAASIDRTDRRFLLRPARRGSPLRARFRFGVTAGRSNPLF